MILAVNLRQRLNGSDAECLLHALITEQLNYL